MSGDEIPEWMSGMLSTFKFAFTRRLSVGVVRRALLGAIGVASLKDGNIGIGVCSKDNMVRVCYIGRVQLVVLWLEIMSSSGRVFWSVEY